MRPPSTRSAVALVVAALALPAAPRAIAEEPRVARIGFLADEATPESGPVLRRTLRDLGWVEGQNVKTWYRYAQGKLALFPGHADELRGIGVHVLVAAGSPAIEAARRGTTTVPRAARVAVLWNPSNPTAALELDATRLAARRLGVELAPVELREDAEFRSALKRLREQDADALLVLADTVTVTRRSDLAVFATKSRLPAVYPLGEFVDAGGLLAYGPTWIEAFHRMAGLVDRILRGARPMELAVERPTRFELLVNLHAAKGLGLAIPSSLLRRADRVIQ